MPLNDSYASASFADRLGVLGLRAVLRALRGRDVRAAQARGAALGRRIATLDRRWRPLAEAQIAACLPTLDAAAAARANYEHYGMLLAELANADRIVADPDFFEVTGLEHAEALRGGGMLITAHLGNWELLGAGHAPRFGPLHALVKPLRSAGLDDWINALRRRIGITPLETRDQALPVLRVLRAGGTIAVLNDQNSLNHEGVFVPFFGRLASTHYGPAMLALRAGVPVVPAFGVRLSDGRARITYEPPIEPPPGRELRERTWLLTAALTARIEAAVRRTPEQWFWVHKRWKNEPAPTTPAWRMPPELRAGRGDE